MSIEDSYIRIKKEVEDACISDDRDPDDVTLLAVSKTVGIEGACEAFKAGARDFGENRPDQLVEKHSALPEARWHFIGNIQSRRIKDIVACSYMIHSLTEVRHAKKIDEAAKGLGRRVRVLIEVNVSGEESKSGISPDAIERFLDSCIELENIELCGLMTMAPLGDLEAAHDCFERLSRYLEVARTYLGRIAPDRKDSFCELSMGMTDDWPIAIACGSTIVRIGRAIFA